MESGMGAPDRSSKNELEYLTKKSPVGCILDGPSVTQTGAKAAR